MSDNSTTRLARSPYLASSWLFFLLVLILSIPFYALGATGDRLPIATFLPVNALMTFVPAIAALILVTHEGGALKARQLLARALDYRRIKSVRWVFAALLLMPAVFLLEYGLLVYDGRALPDAQFSSIARIAAFAVMFFVGAIGEELGWQGYAYAGLKRGRSALEAALIIGVVWALWHVIPFLEMGRSVEWTLWQCLGAIVLRFIIVWLFENTGQSVFIAVLFHMTINMPWGVFTTFEASFDPFVLFVILVIVAATVVGLWGPSTLARFRYVKGHP